MYIHVHALTLTLTCVLFLGFLELAHVTRMGGDWRLCLCPYLVLKDQQYKAGWMTPAGVGWAVCQAFCTPLAGVGVRQT